MIQVKTLVIGLGNPILGDDGVGWRIAESVRQLMGSIPHVGVVCLSTGGISLMENLIGYERAILIDAFVSDQQPGLITVARLEDLQNCSAFHITSAHDTSLQNAMKLGRLMGAKLPEEVTVVGIAANYVYDFSEELSRPVQDAIPKASQMVVDLLMQNIIIQ